MATATLSARRGRWLSVVAELVRREMRIRYRRSLLGVLWVIAQPLAQVAVMAVVFTEVVPLGIEDYWAFVLLGLLPWQWLQAALGAGTTSVVQAADLLGHPRIRRAVLPAAAVGASLVQHVLALSLAIVATLVATGSVPVTSLALIGLVAVQALLCLGPAYALAALHARLRDTARLVSVALVPVFYATPVLYDAEALDAVPALRLNPMVPIVDGYRTALLSGRWPAVGPLLAVAAVGALMLVGGLAVFRARAPRLLEDV